MKRKVLILIAVILSLYVLSYVVFRQTNIEVWDKNNQAYVIFPANKLHLYYLYRPLSYVDAKLTGIGFHIGQH